MSIITLTSDFGVKDYSVAAIKGSLLKQVNDLTIIDISHDITPYCIPETAFILKAAYPNFPKDSIHIVGVDSAQTPEQDHIVAKLNEQYFIGADNGIFSLLADVEAFEEIISIEHPKSKNSNFPTLDVFVDIATQIILGEALQNLGTRKKDLNKWLRNTPDIAQLNEVIAHIVYVDRYGNLVTDLSKTFFDEIGMNRSFEITASNVKIKKINPHYNDIINYELPEEKRKKAGSALAIFNSLDLLEIALFKSDPNHGGSAASLLGLSVGSSVRIIFED